MVRDATSGGHGEDHLKAELNMSTISHVFSFSITITFYPHTLYDMLAKRCPSIASGCIILATWSCSHARHDSHVLPEAQPLLLF